MKLALCAYHPTPDIFHSDKGLSSDAHMEAMKVCIRCPVMVDCEQYRQKIGSTSGIWGGVLQKRNTKQKKN